MPTEPGPLSFGPSMDRHTRKRVASHQGTTCNTRICVDQTEHRFQETVDESNIRAGTALKRHKPASQHVKSTVENGLCEFCYQVFDKWDTVIADNKNTVPVTVRRGAWRGMDLWYVMRSHHWNMELLEASAKSGCMLCVLFRQALVYEKYETPSYFRTKKVDGPPLIKIGELCLYKKTEEKGIACWAAEIHFAHEWVRPRRPMGRLEPVEPHEYRPNPSTHYVYIAPTSKRSAFSICWYISELKFL